MSDLIIPVATIAGSLIGAVLLFLGTRGKTQADRKTALDTLIDKRVQSELERVYKRIDQVEEAHTRKMSAVARILRAIASQWPDVHGPDLDPADLAEVEETIPPAWMRRRPPKES